MKKSILKFSMLFVGVALTATMNAQQVTSGADDGSDGTLRKEIADTPPGGTITVLPIIATINLNSEILINKNITINGHALGLTINAQSNGRVFNITAGNVTMGTLTINNGLATNGGAIQIANATLTMTGVTINTSVANGVSGNGGAILVGTDSKLTATNCTFANNRANRAGGAIEVTSLVDPALDLTGCTFTNNKAGTTPATPNPGNGGAIHITGASNTKITGGTMSGNQAALEGGALWNGTGIMTVRNTTLSANSAAGDAANEGGGAIFNAGGTLIVKNATILNNVATGLAGSGGGILNDLGVLVVDTTSFTGNTAVRAGGAIEDNTSVTSNLTLNNVTMTSNQALSAPGNGGGLHITGAGNSTINGGTFNTNSAGSEGGALWNGSGNMTIFGATINNNTAAGAAPDKGGAGVYNLSGNLTVKKGATITNNKATGASGSGGGILSKAGVVIIDSSFVNSNAARRAGGGIEIIDGSLKISRSQINTNDVNSVAGSPAPGAGAGVHVTGITTVVVIDSTVVEGNIAKLNGGGLWNQAGSTMTLNGVWAKGNTAGQSGGGVYNNGGTMVISRSTLSANTATIMNGGGISNTIGIIAIDHSTISGNTAGNNGAGIYNKDSLTINAATIFENNADQNGGGIFGDSMIYFTNTLMASNTALLGQQLDGMNESMGYNLVENDDNAAFTPMTTDTIDVTPILAVLALNGAITPTHALAVNSVGINRGNPMDSTKDQRGRDIVGTRDIGAYEFTANASVSETNANDVFTVYPNPASTVVNVRLENGTSGVAVISDLNGKEVLRSNVSGNSAVNVSKLNNGMYLMTVVTNAGTQTRKLQIK